MDRRALIREYKRTPRPAGLFSVRNTASGRCLIGVGADLPGTLNRQRFQLEMGSHPDKELQRDWNELGADSFVIEVLDELDPSENSEGDLASDLAALKQAWIEKLEQAGQDLYPMTKRRT